MTDKDREAFNLEFGITSHFCGNGCQHGFKPAKSCVNPDCPDARLHRWWEQQAAYHLCKPGLTDREAFEAWAKDIGPLELDDESHYNYTNNDVEWAWQGWEAGKHHYAPKLTEREAVEVATNAIHGAAFRGVISGHKPAMRDGVTHMIAALRAAGVRFKEES